MNLAQKIIRVFVSSTFGDLKAERNALQPRVFPRLRALCAGQGWRFQAIDLRWGVSEEAGLDQRTMRICLNEIERCRRVSPRPNFIVLLGDRYGWRPLPEQIPAHEFERIKDLLERDADLRSLDLLEWREDQPEDGKGWYRRDDNALYELEGAEGRQKGMYILQPRQPGGPLEDYEAWRERVEAPLGEALRRAAERMELPGRDRLKYGSSATEQEIAAGALTIPDAEDHVFTFFREIKANEERPLVENLPSDASIGAYFDMKAINGGAELDIEARERLEDLKARLLKRIGAKNSFAYDCEWLGHGVSAYHLDALCEDVYNCLSRIIQEQIDCFEDIAPHRIEIQQHHEFGDERARFFTGRAEPLAKIAAYLEPSERRPLALHGPSGSGKSALMARAEENSRRAHPSARHVARFIGATPDSSNGRALLEGLCREISECYGADASDIPLEYKDLVAEFPKRLALATAETPLVVFLDAIDQLSDADGARWLTWLPRELPGNARVVISMTDEEYERSPARALESELPLAPMPRAEGIELLDRWLADAGRALRAAQRGEIEREFERCPLPLYLKLAFEEARLWRSYDGEPDLGSDIPGILRNLFDRLSHPANHGPLLVERALGYIRCSKNGLSEDELLEILARDEEYWNYFRDHAKHDLPDASDDTVQRANASISDRNSAFSHQPLSLPMRSLPVVIWSRLYHDLAPYMTERAADGSSLVNLYHRQFDAAIDERYLAADDAKAIRHGALAAYFGSQPVWIESNETESQGRNTANLRKVSELVHHQIGARLWDELETALADLPFLEAYSCSGRVFALVRDMDEAVNALPAGRFLRRMLELLDEAIRRDIHFIAQHARDYPQGLFQCAWNYGWWYDCPDAAKYYETPNEGWKLPPPWERTGPKLSALLEKWRATKEKEAPGFPWIRSLRPPSVALGSGLKAVLRGHESSLTSVAFSPDGRRIASGSLDKTVRFWDAGTGAERTVLRGHEGEVSSVAFSPDGRRIASGSNDNTVRLWDAGTGTELAVLRGHESTVYSVAFSPNGRRIASGSLDKTVRLWDAGTGAELAVLRGHENPVESVAFSPDGRRIASGSGDNTVRLWDAETGAEQAVLRGHEEWVTSVAFSPDGQRIASGSRDKTVRLWDAGTGAERAVLRGHESIVESVAFSPGGRRIASGGGYLDNTVRLWDAGTGAELAILRGHEAAVTSVAFSPDGRQIASGSRDKTVRLWEAGTGAELAVLRGHEGDVASVAFSRDGGRIVSGSGDVRFRFGDNTVRLWDAEMGAERAVLRGHEWIVNSVVFSPDGRRIASGSWDWSVRLWDAGTGAERAVLRGHEGFVCSVVFSPDGRRIASGSQDDTVRLWDAETGAEQAVLRGHEDWVTSVAFSPDGRRMASAGDTTVRLWDAGTGAERAVLHGHERGVYSVAFSPDGQRIASGSGDDTVRLWDAASGECLEAIQGSGDVFAIAAGAAKFPFRALLRSEETVVELAESARMLARFPAGIVWLTTHPNGRVWAGSVVNYLCLITLEGAEAESHERARTQSVERP